MADELPDPRPGESLCVQERYAAVAEVVRGETRHTCPRTGSRESGSEAIGTESAEHRPLRDAVIAGNERRHRGEHLLGWRDPSGRANEYARLSELDRRGTRRRCSRQSGGGRAGRGVAELVLAT